MTVGSSSTYSKDLTNHRRESLWNIAGSSKSTLCKNITIPKSTTMIFHGWNLLNSFWISTKRFKVLQYVCKTFLSFNSLDGVSAKYNQNILNSTYVRLCKRLIYCQFQIKKYFKNYNAMFWLWFSRSMCLHLTVTPSIGFKNKRRIIVRNGFHQFKWIGCLQ